MSNILVIYEIRDSAIKKVSFEVTSAAVQIAKSLNATTCALLIGSGVGQLAEEPKKYGAEKTYVIDNAALAKYSPDVYAKLIASAAKEIGANTILMGASSMGKDLLPRVAFHLDSPMAQDITGIDSADSKIVFTRPVIAGKLISKVALSSSYQLATVRPNTFQPEPNEVSGEVEKMSPEIPSAKAVVEEVLAEAGGKLDVTEAEIIVSGGRGMQGPENWNLIEDLAKALGAAMGASRAVVDAGWRDHGEQVGQTGKTVSPNLYVACGISGAIQHQAGMASSKYIVAINKDEEAPIFKLADYGIIGDVMEVLPKLTEEIKKVRS